MWPDAFYLWIARWEGIRGLLGTFEVVTNMMCSAADIVFIFCFLRIADIARKEDNRPPIRMRYGVILVFLLLTPSLLLFTGPALMIWTSAILGIPYLVLAWSVVTDVSGIVRLLRRRIARRRGA